MYPRKIWFYICLLKKNKHNTLQLFSTSIILMALEVNVPKNTFVLSPKIG